MTPAVGMPRVVRLKVGATLQASSEICRGRRHKRGMDVLLNRMPIDRAVCHGKSCVRGLRYPAEMLLEMLSSGMTYDQILAD